MAFIQIHFYSQELGMQTEKRKPLNLKSLKVQLCFRTVHHKKGDLIRGFLFCFVVDSRAKVQILTGSRE